MKLDHILVCTDLSPESDRPLDEIGRFARTVGADVTLLHVVHETPAIGSGGLPPVPIDYDEFGRLIRTAESAVAERADRLGGEAEARAVVVSGSRVADTVLDYAREHDVDLIALSTHGRTGFRRLVLGSVASDLISGARVPVLVFPRREE